MGIIVLACIIVLMVISAYSVPKWKGDKGALVAALIFLCSAVSILLVVMFLIIRPEREKTIDRLGYERGVQQQWIKRVDTVYVPKTK